jgi:chromosomal replication initiator protein
MDAMSVMKAGGVLSITSPQHLFSYLSSLLAAVTQFALLSAVPWSLKPKYTFLNFVVGRSNEAAYSAASAAAVAPGKLYNPILITGGTGLGKTHLAHAVVAESNLRAERRSALITADEFLHRLAEGVAAGNPRSVLGELEQASLLVIDDVHVLDRHAAAQDALASLAAHATASDRQLLLTSDDARGADALAARLVSHFRQAHIATLGVPDWSHRVAILHAKAQSLGVELPPSVAHHLAAQCEGSVRELEGSITRLLAVAELEGAALSLALARRAIPTRRPNGSVTSGAQEVQEAVAAEWGVSPDALVGAGRTRAVAEPRRIGMLLCREMLALSIREIGSAFGDRDSSTVLSALERARNDLLTDAVIADRVTKLRQLLPVGAPASP